MKRLLTIACLAILAIAANAQKFALIDMDYILKNIPAYERANEQLNQVSKKHLPCTRTSKTKLSSFHRNRRRPARRLS